MKRNSHFPFPEEIIQHKHKEVGSHANKFVCVQCACICLFVCFVHLCLCVRVSACLFVWLHVYLYVCVLAYECLCLCLCVSLLIPKKGEWTNVSQIPKTPPHSCQNRSGCLSIHSHSEHAQGNFGKCGAHLHEYFEYFVAIFCSEIIVLHEYLQTEYLSSQWSLVWSSFTWS